MTVPPLSANAMPMTQDTADAHILERLYAVIESRRGADPGTSYTAKLFSKGTEKIARKLAEESVEALIEGIKGDRDRLAAESADVLYHLLVLWADQGVRPEDVWAELARREGVSGIEEKNARR